MGQMRLRDIARTLVLPLLFCCKIEGQYSISILESDRPILRDF